MKPISSMILCVKGGRQAGEEEVNTNLCSYCLTKLEDDLNFKFKGIHSQLSPTFCYRKQYISAGYRNWKRQFDRVARIGSLMSETSYLTQANLT